VGRLSNLNLSTPSGAISWLPRTVLFAAIL
jgi:hypothetical protein